MNNIPSAKQSPRIENGVLCWYDGDTFNIDLEIDLEDQDGDPITIASTDTVTIVFKNEEETSVKTFTFTNVSNNTVRMDFDATCSALFPAGKYTYRATIQRTDKTTLAGENIAVVE